MRVMDHIKRLLRNEKGETALIGLVKFFIFFTIIGIGVEFYRFQTYHSTLQTRLEIIVQDALELSVKDEYRRERVSKIVAAEAEENLIEVLMTELNLNYSLQPQSPSILQYPLVISNIEIVEGSFTNDGADYYNTEYPSMRIRGYTHQRIILIPFLAEELKRVEIPFNVYIENRRYD